MTRVADTSFLYAAFDAADARHDEARDELAKPHALDVPLCVLAEFLDLLAYRHGPTTARRIARDLQSLPTFGIGPIGDEGNVLALWSGRPELSMADATGVQSCLENRGRLLSYDTRQHQALRELRGEDPAPGGNASVG